MLKDLFRSQFDKILIAVMMLAFLPVVLWLEIKYPDSQAAHWGEGLMTILMGSFVTLLRPQRPLDAASAQLPMEYKLVAVKPEDDEEVPADVRRQVRQEKRWP
jgi:hypothetical protein